MIEADNIEYSEKTLAESIQNILPLAVKHFEEAEHTFPDKEVKLNMDTLNVLEENDALFILVAIDKSINKLVGYSVFYVEDSILSNIKAAAELGLYVAPEYRNLGIASELLLRSEVLLKTRGVEAMKMVLKDKNKGLHTTIYDLGYELEDLGYYKRI